jgi:type II secretory pathway pseudopilin PulG
MLIRRRAPDPKRERSRVSSRAGFTILEVTLAAFVLLFAISSALYVMQAGFRALDLARTTTVVSQLLQSEIETVRLMNWGDVSKMEPDNPVHVAWAYEGSVKLPQSLQLTRTVRAVPTPTGSELPIEPDVRQIVVAASWITADGRSHLRSTSTQYGKNGLNDYYASAPTH